MSGFVGVWHTDGAPVGTQLLEELWRPIAHRGPDHVGRWCDGVFGLAAGVHRILPGSEHEEQPFVGAGGDVLVFDGRLDNRSELASLGVSNASPDGLVALAAFERWGDGFVERLAGEWAAAVIRPAHAEILLARDPVGTKPLYFARRPSMVAFASEVKAILAHPAVAAVPNDDMLGYYLLQGTARDNSWETFFDGVSTVKPGTIVRISPVGVRARTFWDFAPGERVRLRSYDEYVEAFRALFETAVRRRLRNRHPVAVSLSGGLDSSSVLCQALALREREAGIPDILPVHHRGPVGTASDEWEFVEAIERRWAIEVPTVPLRVGSLLDNGTEQAAAMEMPWLNELWETSVAFADVIRASGATTFLTGHWGDQVLYEQAYLVDSFNRGRWFAVARDLHELASWEAGAGVRPFAGRFASQLVRWDAPRPLVPLLRSIVAPRKTARERTWFSDRLLRHAIAPDPPPPSVGLSRTRVHARNLYAKLRSKYYQLALEGDDKAMSSLGVGASAPFLDRDLLAFVMAIPGDMTTFHGRQRSILRDAMRGLVPDAVVERRSKADFTRLSSEGLATDLVTAPGALTSGEAARRGYLDIAQLESAIPELQAAAQATDVFPGAISDLLGFELWLRWVEDISRVQSPSDSRAEGEDEDL